MTWFTAEDLNNLNQPLQGEIRHWATQNGLSDSIAIDFDPLHGLVCQVRRYQRQANGDYRLNDARDEILTEEVDITTRKLTFPDEFRRQVLTKVS